MMFSGGVYPFFLRGKKNRKNTLILKEKREETLILLYIREGYFFFHFDSIM